MTMKETARTSMAVILAGRESPPAGRGEVPPCLAADAFGVVLQALDETLQVGCEGVVLGGILGPVEGEEGIADVWGDGFEVHRSWVHGVALVGPTRAP